MALTLEWFTAADVAAMALPGMPNFAKNVIEMAEREDWRRPEWANKRWRRREASGGGFEYHWSVLPPAARMVWSAVHLVVSDAAPACTTKEAKHADVWAWFLALTDKKKDEAKRRLRALQMIEDLVEKTRRPKRMATIEAAAAFAVGRSTIAGWDAMVRNVPRAHWLPYLAPRHTGRTVTAECSPEAWEWIKAAYLRPEKPNFADCYRDLTKAAAAHGWTIPAEITLWRRIERDVPTEVKVLSRQGVDALKRLYPAQQRDRGCFHAMEAVNADGHKIDVFVQWPGGEIIRPMLIVFQDLYSGKILSCRVDRSENLEAVRMAFGDMIETYGVPEYCTLDNTRTFASKRLTGGMSNRFRFKVKPEDPAGIMTTLGVKVRWSTPYSGQSKPIERAFRDFAANIAKHPRFAGAYVGNNPMAKPENYGSKAVPLDTFLEVVSERIAEHNARPGRRTAACAGSLSFDQAFEASYSTSIIRKATEGQMQMCLLAADDVTVRIDGIHFHGNRYWNDCLVSLVGKKVTIRFDPDTLHEPVHVYRLDGARIGAAECLEAAGFYDLEAAREHGRKRRAWIKAKRVQLDAELSMTIGQAATLLAKSEGPVPPPQTKLVRPIFAGSAARKIQPDQEPEDARPLSENYARYTDELRARALKEHGFQVIEGGWDVKQRAKLSRFRG